MKTTEDIQKEYDNYISEIDYINSLQDFKRYLILEIEANNNNKYILRKDYRHNKRNKIIGKIISFILLKPNNDSYYEEDNKIILDCFNLVEIQNTYFNNIMKVVNIYNYLELLRLTDFSVKYYNKHISYYEMKRDRLENAYQGIIYSNGSRTDDIKVFDDFFYSKLNELTNPLGIVKTIKV